MRMRWLGVLVVAMVFTGCSTPKIKKAYDEGYAKGYGNGRLDERMATNEDPELKNLRARLGNCIEAANQLRTRLEACQSANVEK